MRKRTSRGPAEALPEAPRGRGTGGFYYNGGVPRPLPRSFYARPTLEVARELLGCVLVRRVGGSVLRARIVETEAYVGEEDRACHARAGRTPRTDVMYGPPGVAYIYLTYGMHHLLNAVTEPEGRPAAVLIRAAEPLEGLERMALGRGIARDRADAESHRLASGPAKLCRALSLDLDMNRADLGGRLLWIEPGDALPDAAVARSARIGCETAPAPWDRIEWRFFEAASRFVTPGRSTGRVRDVKTGTGKSRPRRR